MTSEGMYRDLAGSSFTLGTPGATTRDISSGRGAALVTFCLAFRRSSFCLKFRSAENLKLNTAGRAGWRMLGELGDSWRSRVGDAGLSGGGDSTGTGRGGASSNRRLEHRFGLDANQIL